MAHPTYEAEYFLGPDGQDLVFHVSNYNHIALGIVPGAINEANRWYHVAATWSGDSYTVYVDGVARESGTCTPQTTYSNTVDVQIGRHGTWSWVYFQGIIDEAKIYNYARTAEEIWNDYVTPLSASISPLSTSINVGDSVAFTSTVGGGTAPYSYQWYLNDNPVSGATLNTWTFTPATTGSYTVHLNVTDNLGNIVKSNEASVAVAAQLTASISPMSASVLVGQPVAFTSTVSGGYAPYSYQWYLNGNPVSGATSVSWTFTPTTSGIYYVYLKVTDAIGNTTQSETARIMVTSVPVGGYSVSLTRYSTAMPSSVCLALLIMLSVVFTTVRRKTRRKK
jgi:hypothetical protein